MMCFRELETGSFDLDRSSKIQLKQFFRGYKVLLVGPFQVKEIMRAIPSSYSML